MISRTYDAQFIKEYLLIIWENQVAQFPYV